MGNIKAGDLEKIYTPKELTNFIIDILLENIDYEPECFLEPAAGSGQMLDVIKERFPNKEILAYDIFNETKREDIVELDFLNKKHQIAYNERRVCIMNPPFNKGLKFVYKTLESCKTCVCILSINSFMNLDYDKYYVKEIYLNNKAEFSDGKTYGICMMVIEKKVEDDDFWN